jgi:hypothetical protein
MTKILFYLAAKYNVAAVFLEYIGAQDERETLGINRRLVIYHFNITDPTHARYDVGQPSFGSNKKGPLQAATNRGPGQRKPNKATVPGGL